MPRHKEVFAIRKLKDQLPALAMLRDLIGEGMANVDTKVADPTEKVAHYKILTRFQTQVNAELAKLTNPQKPVTPAMQPLL